ncbi:hypothetical protein JZO66_04090 [Enterococcus sp. DIV0242_7C1]|uniref:hypothetical protein n=1 Tax=Enterococcus sp. DIV0242_7C1 TaxID=2815323 RepID=UPI001A912640|nr:hypothetical protein [Enterococcus sp. DIV0242_7C1]MBO0469715.1 hypothetical protein [Enterococcus sp. DIV0242_7C1]
MFITTTGYARVDDEQYLATKGSEVSILVNHPTLEFNPKEEKQLQKESKKSG